MFHYLRQGVALVWPDLQDQSACLRYLLQPTHPLQVLRLNRSTGVGGAYAVVSPLICFGLADVGSLPIPEQGPAARESPGFARRHTRSDLRLMAGRDASTYSTAHGVRHCGRDNKTQSRAAASAHCPEWCVRTHVIASRRVPSVRIARDPGSMHRIRSSAACHWWSRVVRYWQAANPAAAVMCRWAAVVGRPGANLMPWGETQIAQDVARHGRPRCAQWPRAARRSGYGQPMP